MRVGIDAHKMKCTTVMFDGDSVTGSFDFQTTRQGVYEFMEKVPEGSIAVIESSTTGKVLSRMLSGKYEVHMVAPPERKVSIKTDRRDAERIVMEDMLNYLRRCYIPSQYIENIRFVITQQIQIGRRIARVKNQVHALLEMNMIQHELDDMADIFGVKGLNKLSKIQLPRHDMVALARYLEELKMYVSHHRQLDTEIARIAASDNDVQLLMTIPGINCFTAVAIKSRIGEVSRFATKKHLCSYAGVVPKANNSGEYISEHNHVKQGDIVLKYALTCAVRGAILANKNSSIKLFYRKISKKGVSPQKAQIAAARKMACIVWKVLSSKQPYTEQDDRMTKRKMKIMSSKAMRIIPTSVMPSKVSELVRNLVDDIDVLGKHHEDSDYIIGKDLSNKNRLKEDILR
jgi:transposase